MTLTPHLGEFGVWLFWGYVFVRATLAPSLFLLLILFVVGSLRGWRWVKNPWLRLGHFALSCLLALDILTNFSEDFGVSLIMHSSHMYPNWSPSTAHWLIYYGLPGTEWMFLSNGLVIVAAVLFFVYPPYEAGTAST